MRNSTLRDIVVLGICLLLFQLHTGMVHIDIQMADERRQHKIEKAGKGDPFRGFSCAFGQHSYG